MKPFSFCLLYFTIFASVRVTQTSKAMQTTAIRTVAKSLPKNEVNSLTILISSRYIPFAELLNILDTTKNSSTSCVFIIRLLK